MIANRECCAGPWLARVRHKGRSATTARESEKDPPTLALLYVYVFVIRGPHEPAGVGRYHRPTVLIIIVKCGGRLKDNHSCPTTPVIRTEVSP